MHTACVTGRRPLGAAAWRSGSLFSFEQGVLGHKQMATGQTGTGWASSVPGAQLERKLTAAPTAASMVQGPAQRQRGARAPHQRPVSPPPKAGALPPGTAGCRGAARTARTSLLGARGTLAALSRPEPHGDVGGVAAGGASLGCHPLAAFPGNPTISAFHASPSVCFSQSESEEKVVTYDHIGPSVCMGDHKVTRAVPRSGGWARGAGRGGLSRLGAMVDSASTAPLLRLLSLLHRGGQVGLFLFNFNEIPEGRWVGAR